MKSSKLFRCLPALKPRSAIKQVVASCDNTCNSTSCDTKQMVVVNDLLTPANIDPNFTSAVLYQINSKNIYVCVYAVVVLIQSVLVSSFPGFPHHLLQSRFQTISP